MDISVFKWIVDLFIESLLNFFAQHVNIGFVNVFALLYQGDSIINVDVGELVLFLLPIFIQNKQQLFCSSGTKNWKKAFSS
jgi:hypothetical protein